MCFGSSYDVYCALYCHPGGWEGLVWYVRHAFTLAVGVRRGSWRWSLICMLPLRASAITSRVQQSRLKQVQQQASDSLCWPSLCNGEIAEQGSA